MRYLALLLLATALACAVPALVSGGVTRAPLRAVAEALGGTVAAKDGGLTVALNGHTARLRVGSTAATVDGAARTLPAPPVMLNGTVYVPAFFLRDAFGVRVRENTAAHTLAFGVELTLPLLREAIVFESAGSIFRMDPDGGNLTKLTAGKTGASAPRVSPDGTRVLYIQGNTTLMQVRPDGTNATEVSAKVGLRHIVAFSPDSQRLLVNQQIVDLAHPEAARITVAEDDLIYTLWHPNGTELLGITITDDRFNLIRFSIGRPRETLLEQFDGNLEPRGVTPDGHSLLLFIYFDGDYPCGNARLFNLKTRKLTLLTLPAESEGEKSIDGAVLSPDGVRVAYLLHEWNTKTNTERYILKLVKIDGSERTTLYVSPTYLGDLTFSPDGTRLAFVNGGDIYTLNRDGSGLAQLTTKHRNASPQWCWLP
jgi:Tol biopolymer transport system component